MKTIELKLYKFDELSEEAKRTAVENYSTNGVDDFWGSERIASYEKAKEIYNSLSGIDGEISGKRLVAWIENNLSHYWRRQNKISKHKLPQTGVITKKRVLGDCFFVNSWWEWKYDCIKFRTSNIFETNDIEGCPLTGVCYDYDFLQPIIDFMKNPSSNISNVDLVDDMPSYESIAERDHEYTSSYDFIAEELSVNDYDFTEDGEIY